MKELDYDKKIALCKILGADKFKKVVEKVEQLKFKVLKKFFPSYIKRYDKRMDKILNKQLSKITDPVERKELIREVNRQKILIRKEHRLEQNRNYHMDENNPKSIINYLKWNKAVHIKGLKIDAISIAILGLIATQTLVVLPFIALEGIDAILNMQCINIQNCNIYRYEKDKERLDRLSDKKMKKNVKKYGEFAKVVGKELSKENKELPNGKDLTSAIRTEEEYLQALDITIDQLKKRGNIEKVEILNQKKEQLLTKINNRNEMKSTNEYSSGGKVKVYD